jgi:hypothetical protein
MEIVVNNYLVWQQANINVAVSTPDPVADHMPDWWKQLPGNLTGIESGCPHRSLLVEHGLRSAKFCLGLRGAKNIGYTIPLDQDISLSPYNDALLTSQKQKTAWQIFYENVKDQSWPNCDTEQDFDLLPDHVKQECQHTHGYAPQSQTKYVMSQVKTNLLHPEMLHGTMWAEKKQQGQFNWQIAILSWPWRAKLPKGWRLLLIPNQFDWSPDYRVFVGCVDANYQVNGNNIGNFWDFEYTIDQDHNYFNIETVIAVTPGKIIPKGTTLFSMVPVYDPDYVPHTHKTFPNFVNHSL